MIRLGICAGWERAGQAANIGYDYIEMGLAATASMTDKDYHTALETVLTSPIRAEAFNVMLPSTLSLTGADISLDPVITYLERAIPRAAAFGAQVIVFGSGGARRVPERWDTDSAWAQLIAFLRVCLPYLEEHGIALAIEPLRKAETNIIHTVREGASLAAAVGYPFGGESRFSSYGERRADVNRWIGVLGDTYHMAAEGEGYQSLIDAKDLLKHVHTAESATRAYPSIGDGTDYKGLFAALNSAGYSGRVSVEGRTDDFDTDAPRALAALQDARDKAFTI
ncbi:MAG: sugar phosphate isomerase/epimerase [Oscillospiraceae bacterium]|jgi:sugar phosphate isomerase/epimerase|nr:sugar phosphate isomerase/epimerase [Oscillospiraceae bacterium]